MVKEGAEAASQGLTVRKWQGNDIYKAGRSLFRKLFACICLRTLLVTYNGREGDGCF